MSEMTGFSVSMCVYEGDQEDHFDCALNSVIHQTIIPSQIVLTVDGPIREEINIVIQKYEKSLADTSIEFDVIRLEKNMGHGEARRISFEHCRYPLIALMDADDISVSDRFEKQIKFFRENPDVSVVGGQIREFVTAHTPTDISNTAGVRHVPLSDADIKMFMKKRCPMNQVTVMFRAEDIISVGGYIDWYCEEDYYLWIRLAMAGFRFGNLPMILVNVRVGENMYKRRGGIRYYKSEVGIQKLMLKNELISIPVFFYNCAIRLIIQVLLPNCLRGLIFRRIARS